MVIAILIALGVEAIIIVAFAVIVLGRKRSLKRQPGTFAGAIRLVDGELDGLSAKWKRGSGRWVRDVFVWHKAPLLFRTELIPVDQMSGVPGELVDGPRRLGDAPIVVAFCSGSATFEIAAKSEDLDLVVGLWSTLAPVSSSS